MSRSHGDSPFSPAATDPFLTPLATPDIKGEHLDSLYAIYDSNDEPLFPGAESTFKVEDLGFRQWDGIIAPANSTSTTPGTATPNITDYEYGQHQDAAQEYAAPTSSRPYSLQLQQPFEPQPAHHLRAHTVVPPTTEHHVSTNSRAHLPSHGRSLSQNHADQLAAAAQTFQGHTPTFYRMQKQSTRSIGTEEKAKGENTQTSRNTRQGKRHKRSKTSAPANVQVRDLQPRIDGLPSGCGTGIQMLQTLRAVAPSVPIQLTGPKTPEFRYMSHAEQLAQSLRVIEVGAMAIVKSHNIDPQLQNLGPEPQLNAQGRREVILQKLDDVESHLRHEEGDYEDGLIGCGMIRDALDRIGKGEDISGGSNTVFLRFVENRW